MSNDQAYLSILHELEELYPNASGEVLAAAARCEAMMRTTVEPMAPVGNVVSLDERRRVRR